MGNSPDSKKGTEPTLDELCRKSKLLRATIKPEGNIIGRSDHSVVYQGTLTGSGKRVIIKADRRPLLENYGDIERKIKTLRSLQHPYIARLEDFIPDWDKEHPENSHAYIIMQYIEGTGLNQLLEEDGPQKQARVLHWAYQLLDALHYLHGQGHAHGGIRPGNIVITDGGNACFVDFQYVSDELTGKDDGSSIKGFRFDIYEDPKELEEGIQRDIYHLGRVLFRALTGVSYKDCGSEDDARKLLDSYSVTDTVSKIVLDAVNNRFGSAMEMLKAIHELNRVDTDFKQYRRLLKQGYAACVAMCLAGLVLAFTGSYQIAKIADRKVGEEILRNQIMQMTSRAGEAEAELRVGDYSGALESVRASLDWGGIKTDIPVPEESELELAKFLGVYNPVDMYLPYRSDYPLDGTISGRAVFSPSGKRIAVVTDVNRAKPPVRHIQIFDAASAREEAVLTVGTPSFVFLDEDTILYAGEASVQAFSISRNRPYRWTGGPVDKGDGRNSVAARTVFSVSEDETTAASLNRSSGEVYLYKTADIQAAGFADAQEASGTESGKALVLDRTWNSEKDVYNETDGDVLLALNKDGTLLGLSFPDGEVRIYRTDGQESPSGGLNNCIVPAVEDMGANIPVSREAEGGFYNGYFFYAMTHRWLISGRETSQAAVVRVSVDEGTL
ncbi:MAG: protein kinase, partial [Oscillibacter sp.]|nr:protein kinase [Oscillibacter sp.]